MRIKKETLKAEITMGKTTIEKTTTEVENNCSERKKSPFGQILPVLGRALLSVLVYKIIEVIID